MGTCGPSQNTTSVREGKGLLRTVFAGPLRTRLPISHLSSVVSLPAGVGGGAAPGPEPPLTLAAAAGPPLPPTPSCHAKREREEGGEGMPPGTRVTKSAKSSMLTALRWGEGEKGRREEGAVVDAGQNRRGAWQTHNEGQSKHGIEGKRGEGVPMGGLTRKGSHLVGCSRSTPFTSCVSRMRSEKEPWAPKEDSAARDNSDAVNCTHIHQQQGQHHKEGGGWERGTRTMPSPSPSNALSVRLIWRLAASGSEGRLLRSEARSARAPSSGLPPTPGAHASGT